MENEKEIEYSVVIPVFNEESLVDELYSRVSAVMAKLGCPYEIIFVDDGSRDRTFPVLKAISAGDSNVKIISFSRNFGHHIAITAGLDVAVGNAVIMMDGDLQDPPEEIPCLVEKFNEGFDIVCAIYRSRQDPMVKRLWGKLFYRVFRIIGKVSIPDNSGIFRVMSRAVVDSVKSCREYSRFIVGLIDWTGYSTAGVLIDRDERRSGKAKYNFFKSLKLAAYAIISFSSFPLHLAAYLGLFFAAASFLVGVYILASKIFFGMAIPGYTSIIVSVLFLGGIELIMIGVIGEYIGKIYSEVQKRPLYLVKQKINFQPKKHMINYLEFDSNLCGRRVGEYTLSGDNSHKTEELISELSSYDIVYLRCGMTPKIYQILKNFDWILADVKIKLAQNINNVAFDRCALAADDFSRENDFGDLICLGRDLYQASRFYFDPNTRELGQKIYEEWIKNSLNKKMAEQVMVCRADSGKVIGFATVKKHADFAEPVLAKVGREFVGEGYGKKLMAKCYNYIASNYPGIEVVAHTQINNTAALKMHQSSNLKMSGYEFVYHVYPKGFVKI